MSQISIRMDEELRRQVDQILGELGLSMSAAVNIFARQVVRLRGIPFPLTLPEQNQTDRRENFEILFEIADMHPVNLPEGYKFNRDECYDK